MKRAIFLTAVSLALAGCVAYQTRSDGIARARLGETVTVDGPRVTPLKVLEDSRCPANVQCVWAGQVRLSVRIDLGSGSETREIVSNNPLPVADGTLTLVEVVPAKKADQPTYSEEYRFGFKSAGGI
jgi:hypothetical protein